MKRTLLICGLLSLCLCLTAFSCGGTTDPNATPAQVQAAKADEALKNIKLGGKILAQALDRGIPLEKSLAEAGEIDASFEPDLRQGLLEAKKDVDTFNADAADWEHLDVNNKKEIAAFAKRAVDFIDHLNNQGLLHIKNPKSRVIASLTIEGARTAITLLDSMSTAAPAPAPVPAEAVQ